jgi:5-methylcytosine-specific restriction protein A
MPIRLCLEPKCPTPARYRGRCAEHAAVNERRTHNPEHRRIYNSKRWKVLRERVLTDQPLCPCGQIASDVDHIKALEDGGDPWAPGNVQGLCKPCHSVKTAAEKAWRESRG